MHSHELKTALFYIMSAKSYACQEIALFGTAEQLKTQVLNIEELRKRAMDGDYVMMPAQIKRVNRIE